MADEILKNCKICGGRKDPVIMNTSPEALAAYATFKEDKEAFNTICFGCFVKRPEPEKKSLPDEIPRWRLHVNLNGKIPNEKTVVFHIKDDDGQWAKFEDIDKHIKENYVSIEKFKNMVDIYNDLKSKAVPVERIEKVIEELDEALEDMGDPENHKDVTISSMLKHARYKLNSLLKEVE